ncbi:MAG: GldG family protein [Chloroflexota bacterium]
MNDAYKRLTQGLLYAGLLGLFGALAAYFVSGTFGNLPKVLLIVGAGLLIGFAVASPESLLGAAKSRGAKYGGNTAIAIVLVLVIVGAVNFFVSSHSPTFDVTSNHSHTLSAQTIKLLRNLKQDVNVTAFYQSGQFDEQSAKQLLTLYASYSGKFHYRFVDPDKDPSTAQQFGIVSYGTTVFQSGPAKNVQRKDAPSADEQSYTSALIAVTGQLQRKVYFVTGNGQPDPNSSQQQGYHDALTALENDNYVVATLGASLGAVPADAAAVILPAGSQPLLPAELKAFANYLAKGGKMMILSSALEAAGSGSNATLASQQDLNTLIKPFGISFQPGIVVDPASSLPQAPQAPAVSNYAAQGNAIVQNVAVSLFPVPNGISLAQPAPSGISATIIAKTSSQSWLQNHIDNNQLAFRQGDQRGPINLFVTAEGTLPSTSPTPGAGTPTASSGAAAAGNAAASGAPLANATVVATPPPVTPTAQPAASQTPGAAAPVPTSTPTPVANITGSTVNLQGGSKVVAVSDELWLNNTYLNQAPGNRDLFLNSINYLVGNTNLISIAPKSQVNTQVLLLGSDANLIFFVVVVLVPLAVLVVGGTVWWQRR